jgi:hypothetical protein
LSRARRWLAPILTLAGIILAVGLGSILFLNDPVDRCLDAGGRWDARERRCEMAPPPKAVVNRAVVGAAGVARVLDVTSFATSIAPRPDARTLAEYGFSLVLRTQDGVEVYRDDQSWMFAIRVLEEGSDRKVICVIDRALKGGTYSKVSAIEVQPGEAGLWRSTGARLRRQDCAA